MMCCPDGLDGSDVAGRLSVGPYAVGLGLITAPGGLDDI